MSESDYEDYTPRETAPDPKPSVEELAATQTAVQSEKLRLAELEAARQSAKAETMERFVREGFAQGRTQPAPQDAKEAANELGLSEEEILQDPTGAIAKISEQIKKQREYFQEYQNRVGTVVGNLAKSNFKAEMTSLRQQEFAEWLMPHVEDYFRRDPDAALREGEVQRVYNELVGSNYQELQRLKGQNVDFNNGRQPVVEPSMKTSASPIPPKDEKTKLPEDEAFYLAEHNRRSPKQYQMTAEEWSEIRNGKKYPKKISSDIQFRGAKPNVSY